MTKPATSPYLSLRQAVRPAIFAHRLLAGDAERPGRPASSVPGPGLSRGSGPMSKALTGTRGSSTLTPTRGWHGPRWSAAP
jgi:hypothetical protein